MELIICEQSANVYVLSKYIGLNCLCAILHVSYQLLFTEPWFRIGISLQTLFNLFLMNCTWRNQMHTVQIWFVISLQLLRTAEFRVKYSLAVWWGTQDSSPPFPHTEWGTPSLFCAQSSIFWALYILSFSWSESGMDLDLPCYLCPCCSKGGYIWRRDQCIGAVEDPTMHYHATCDMPGVKNLVGCSVPKRIFWFNQSCLWGSLVNFVADSSFLLQNNLIEHLSYYKKSHITHF